MAADFFKRNKQNLNLASVGDYLAGNDADEAEFPYMQATLEAYSEKMVEKGDILAQYRKFLDGFKLPGESQKIDRIINNFSKVYCSKNDKSYISGETAASILLNAITMTNVSLHNPTIKEKDRTKLESFKTMLKGLNTEDQGKKIDFSDVFLNSIFNNIKQNQLKNNFPTEVSPGYQIQKATLGNDTTFKYLSKFLTNSKSTQEDLEKIFPKLINGAEFNVERPKGMLKNLLGYEGTITLTNKTDEKVTIQVYQPGIYSKMLGEKSRVIVQPINVKGDFSESSTIKWAAELTKCFKDHPMCSSTFHYERRALMKAYQDLDSTKGLTTGAFRGSLSTLRLAQKNKNDNKNDVSENNVDSARPGLK